MGFVLVFVVQTLIWGVYGLPASPTPSPFLDGIEENTTTLVIPNKSLCNSENEANVSRFTLHEKTLHWFDALIACWNEGQHLAVPRSPQEAKALAGLLYKLKRLPGEVNNDALHVGIHDIDRDNVWRTLDGYLLSQAGYDLWLEGGKGQCGSLFADGRYLRQPCGMPMRFACEKSRSESASRKATDYIELGDAGRFRLYEEPLPWTLALKNCEAEGTTLAVPENPREAGLLAGVMFTGAPHNTVLREHGFFVGITDVAQEGIWRTVQGDSTVEAGYNEWAPPQPSGSRRKNCGVLLKDGRYGDHQCMSPLPYCCQEIETPRDPEASVVVKGRFRLHKNPLPWFDALQACQRENATFVSVTGRELTHVKELMMKSNDQSTDISDSYGYYGNRESNINPIHVSIYDVTGDKSWKRIYVDDNSKENFMTINSRGSSEYEYYSENQQSNDEHLKIKVYNEDGGSYPCVSMRYDGDYHTVGCDRPLRYVCKRK